MVSSIHIDPRSASIDLKNRLSRSGRFLLCLQIFERSGRAAQASHHHSQRQLVQTRARLKRYRFTFIRTSAFARDERDDRSRGGDDGDTAGVGDVHIMPKLPDQ